MRYFLLLLIFCSTAVAQQIDFPQDTIARNNLFNNREFPAFDSEGKIHVTYTGQLDTDGSTREIYYAYEEGDGRFTTVNLTNNIVDDNYSTLSIDAGNKVHVGYTGRDNSSLFQIFYLTNFTGAFGSPIAVTLGGLNKATPYSKIGPDSIMHFVYFTYTNDPDFTFYRSYNLKTSSLSNEVTLVQAETGGDYDAALDVDLNGKVHIVVKSGSAFGGPLKYYNNITGTITEVPTGVTANVTNPKIKIDKNNNVHIVYRNETDKRLYYINNKTGNFSSPLVITPAGQRPATYQNIGIDDSIRVYVAYQSSVSTSGKGFYLVYGNENGFSDTLKVYEITSEYLLRNSAAVIAKANGSIALFYAPSAMRNGNVVCDIFMKSGELFEPIPVELLSFNASVGNNHVMLNWSTASETNNKGFEVERKQLNAMEESKWLIAGFVNGRGTTTELNHYSFKDENLSAGKYIYRLKQIDYDGSFKYSNEIEVDVNVVDEFVLFQNYPNPFNPTTVIRYSIPGNGKGETGNVSLKIYDVLGNEVAVLVNEMQAPGTYAIEFNASNLSSGVYFYRIETGSFVQTRKMTVVK